MRPMSKTASRYALALAERRQVRGTVAIRSGFYAFAKRQSHKADRVAQRFALRDEVTDWLDQQAPYRSNVPYPPRMAQVLLARDPVLRHLVEEDPGTGVLYSLI